jgi:hypothetical protein
MEEHYTSVLKADPQDGGNIHLKVQHSPTTHKYENVHVGNIYTANIHVHSSASFGMPL